MKLQEIYKDDFQDILDLTSDPQTMKFVGNSKIWDTHKAQRFVEYCYLDRADKNRKNYYYKITNPDFIGIIGYHPFLKFDGMFLTVMLNSKSKNKGFFKKALELLASKVKNHNFLYSLVRKTNDRMISISDKNYYFEKTLKIKQETFNLYRIYLKKYRYIIKSNVLNKQEISKIMKSRGWVESNENEVEFLHIDYDFYSDKGLWKIKSVLKNVLNENKKIVYKDDLYFNIRNLKEHIVRNLNFTTSNFKKVEDFISMSKNKVFIVKPVKSYSGRGIFIIKTYGEFLEEMRRADKRFKKYVIQEYISNPMLYKNKKFHLRLNLFAWYEPKTNKKCIDYLKFYETALAKKEYSTENYKDKDVHDTHFGDSEKNIFFPRDFSLDSKILRSISSQIEKITSEIKKHINFRCYEENKRCYEVFGVDLMITQDHKVKILELNSRIGIPEDEIRYYPGEPLNITLFKKEMEIVDSIFPRR